jgi:small subunit ribosomal protein S6
VLLNISAPPAAVRELERNMGINEDILRFLTVRVEALEEGPSAMLQSRDRGDRGDRGGRGDRGERRPRDRDGDFGRDRGGFERGASEAGGNP